MCNACFDLARIHLQPDTSPQACNDTKLGKRNVSKDHEKICHREDNVADVNAVILYFRYLNLCGSKREISVTTLIILNGGSSEVIATVLP